MVKSVSESIPMSTKYEPAMKDEVNTYTYNVAMPLADEVKDDIHRGSKRASTVSAKSDQSKSSQSDSTTVAEVYTMPQKKKVAGNVNAAFEHEDESPGSSPDSSPVARPKSTQELKTEL